MTDLFSKFDPLIEQRAALLAFLYSDEVEVLQYAVGATMNLCTSADEAKLVLEAGMLQRVMLLTRCGDAVVEEYAADQSLFFEEYTSAWIKLQENGVAEQLRDDL